MNAVRVTIEEKSAVVEYTVHVRNRSKHALTGALRAGWKRYPEARSVMAEWIEHTCDTCAHSHNNEPVRRVFNRTPRRKATA